MYGLQEGRDHAFIQRLQLFADSTGEDAVFSRVGFDIAIGNCLLQSLMKDTMEIADGLGRKSFF